MPGHCIEKPALHLGPIAHPLNAKYKRSGLIVAADLTAGNNVVCQDVPSKTRDR